MGHSLEHVSSEAVKNETETIEISRAATVNPAPESFMVNGGLLISTEGFTNTAGFKLAEDGQNVLAPQPMSHEGDCLNWSSAKKHLLLFTITWDALCADFVGAIGSAPITLQSIEWNLSLDKTNRPNNIIIPLLGLSGLIWIPMTSYWGRAPVLFWIELFAFCFTFGTALSKNYATFFATHALSAVFFTAAQTIPIAFLKDIFFFHEQTRKISPMLGNFVVGKTHNWQDVYWMATGVIALQLILVISFVDEMWFNRTVASHHQPARPQSFHARIMRLLGVYTYFSSIKNAYHKLVVVILQPHFALICFSYFLSSMWAIGINVTTSIIFGTSVICGGYGYNNIQLGWLHFSPIVRIIVAEIFGHFFNGFLARQYIHKHYGVFEPEVRLWPIYIGAIFGIPGIILVGQAIQHHLKVAAVAFSWGMYGLGVMLCSVAITVYSLDSFPIAPAEVDDYIGPLTGITE